MPASAARAPCASESETRGESGRTWLEIADGSGIPRDRLPAQPGSAARETDIRRRAGRVRGKVAERCRHAKAAAREDDTPERVTRGCGADGRKRLVILVVAILFTMSCLIKSGAEVSLMDRRGFFVLSSMFALSGTSPLDVLAVESSAFSQGTKSATARQPILVRAGHTRGPDGTDSPTTSQQTVVRSFDSEGRLSAFVVPVGDHDPYGGAPLHVHHEQDEWLFIVAGEFVAEVGGKRILKPGDSLLMPMKIPHRWSHGGQAHSGVIHLYTPAGLMDVWWDPKPDDNAPQTLEQRKAEFEKYGTTLLGAPLTKEEIDQTT
jgi:mannose-6-phosphate isomerase-like protein (cupin superfamily)